MAWIGGKGFILTLALAAATACQPGPKAPLMSPLAAGAGYGYNEQQLDEARFEVRYVGPNEQTWLAREKRAADSEAARDLSYELALLRAAELAVEKNFAAFTVEDTRTDVEIRIVDNGSPFYAPHLGYDFAFHHLHGPHHHALHFAPPFRSAWLRAEATLTVAMRSEMADGALDARATAERLKEKHAKALEPR